MVLSYAPADRRPALNALFALDDALADILRSTREPMVGQMRLTWWHGALARLDDGPPPAQPVLQGLATAALPRGVTGIALAGLVEGWEVLLESDALTDTAVLERYADGRGAVLFTLACRVLDVAPTDPLIAGGRGWALADLAAHSSAPGVAGRLARPLLAEAGGVRWSRATRSLGALVRLQAMPGASPARRTMRALAHRLTGR